MVFSVSSESLLEYYYERLQFFWDIMVALNCPAGSTNELFMRDICRYYTKMRLYCRNSEPPRLRTLRLAVLRNGTMVGSILAMPSCSPSWRASSGRPVRRTWREGGEEPEPTMYRLTGGIYRIAGNFAGLIILRISRISHSP